MSHLVVVDLIADQTILINGEEVNIHDLKTIILSDHGYIIGYRLKSDESIKYHTDSTI